MNGLIHLSSIITDGNGKDSSAQDIMKLCLVLLYSFTSLFHACHHKGTDVMRKIKHFRGFNDLTEEIKLC